MRVDARREPQAEGEGAQVDQLAEALERREGERHVGRLVGRDELPDAPPEREPDEGAAGRAAAACDGVAGFGLDEPRLALGLVGEGADAQARGEGVEGERLAVALGLRVEVAVAYAEAEGARQEEVSLGLELEDRPGGGRVRAQVPEADAHREHELGSTLRDGPSAGIGRAGRGVRCAGRADGQAAEVRRRGPVGGGRRAGDGGAAGGDRGLSEGGRGREQEERGEPDGSKHHRDGTSSIRRNASPCAIASHPRRVR